MIAYLSIDREKRVTRSYTQTTYTGWRRWARIEQGGGDAQPQYKQVKLHEVSSAQVCVKIVAYTLLITV